MSLPVRTTARADGHVRRAVSWWKANRPASPGLFAQELADAFRLVGDAPRIGHELDSVELPNVWRILLPRTRYHVYYRLDADPARVTVVAIWGAVRGRMPKLGA